MDGWMREIEMDDVARQTDRQTQSGGICLWKKKSLPGGLLPTDK